MWTFDTFDVASEVLFKEHGTRGNGRFKWLFQSLQVQSQKSGKGVMKWPDGRLYKGTYLKVGSLLANNVQSCAGQDRKHGRGCFVWS